VRPASTAAVLMFANGVSMVDEAMFAPGVDDISTIALRIFC
jgi:hypothetical protein